MYDPVTAKFLRDDPIRYASGDTNLSRYVGNNPINFIDPSGCDRVETQWNDKEKRFDVYTVRQKFEIVTDGLSDSWKGAGEEKPVLIGSIDNETGLVAMFGKYTTMEEVVKEAHHNGTWSAAPDAIASNWTNHFTKGWREEHLFDKDAIETMQNATGLRGALIGLSQLAYEQQVANARTPAEKQAAQDWLDKQIADVFKGTDLAADAVRQAAWFYLTAPLNLAEATNAARALKYADSASLPFPEGPSLDEGKLVLNPTPSYEWANGGKLFILPTRGTAYTAEELDAATALAVRGNKAVLRPPGTLGSARVSDLLINDVAVDVIKPGSLDITESMVSGIAAKASGTSVQARQIVVAVADNFPLNNAKELFDAVRAYKRAAIDGSKLEKLWIMQKGRIVGQFGG